MKTNEEIAEMAEKHARESWGVYYDDKHPDSAITETVGEITVTDFIKGYEAAQEEMKWIDCKDELPIAIIGFIDCLTFRNGLIRQGRFNALTQRFQDMNFKDVHDTITHWQYLPQKPLMP